MAWDLGVWWWGGGGGWVGFGGGGGAGAAWWLFVRPLPQVDGTAPLAGLQHEVSVERDIWGIPHVRAGSLADMAEAQGDVMAQDRLWPKELLGRGARGELSGIVGPVALSVGQEISLNR